VKKNAVIANSLIIGLIFFNCASNSGIVNTKTGMNVTARGTSEGINLHFDNIPENTTDITVVLVDINKTDRPEGTIYVNDKALEDLKRTGNLLCPFVKTGREYFIRIYLQFGLKAEKYVTGAIAGGGIYMTNNPLLHFINGNNFLTLSEMPTFSEEVIFYLGDFLIYYSYLRKENGSFYGVGFEGTKNLNSDYSVKPSIETKEELAKEYSIVFSGDVPMYGEVYCFLDYEINKWLIAVAQSEDVLVTF
jgi:hypothetical protein